jgi:hypothetical protein
MRAPVAPAKAQAEVDAGKGEGVRGDDAKMLDLRLPIRRPKKAQADNERS